MRYALSALLLAAGGVAQAETLLIDTARSGAEFSVRAMWVKRIDGRFGHVEGVIEHEPGARSFGVDVRIAAQSVWMDREENAAWARGVDFFDALRHPWIQFHATGQPLEILQHGGELSGTLTLRGVTRQVSFQVEPSTCARPGVECAVQARGEVHRSEFGMNARRIVLGDRVRLELTIRAHAATAHEDA